MMTCSFLVKIHETRPTLEYIQTVILGKDGTVMLIRSHILPLLTTKYLNLSAIPHHNHRVGGMSNTNTYNITE